MCTCLFSFQPEAAWPILILSVRDEVRDRGFDPPYAWWPAHAGIVGPRDRQAGGTWLAIDPALGTVAVVLNRLGEREGDRVSRGELPLAAIRRPELAATLGGDAAPSNLLRFDRSGVRWLRSDVDGPAGWATIAPGLHIVTSWDVDDPARPKHGSLLARTDSLGAPPIIGDSPDWTAWRGLLADDWESIDVEHRLTIVDHPDVPGYGTSAAALIGIRRDGAVELTFCDNHPACGRWSSTTWSQAAE